MSATSQDSSGLEEANALEELASEFERRASLETGAEHAVNLDASFLAREKAAKLKEGER